MNVPHEFPLKSASSVFSGDTESHIHEHSSKPLEHNLRVSNSEHSFFVNNIINMEKIVSQA